VTVPTNELVLPNKETENSPKKNSLIVSHKFGPKNVAKISSPLAWLCGEGCGKSELCAGGGRVQN